MWGSPAFSSLSVAFIASKGTFSFWKNDSLVQSQKLLILAPLKHLVRVVQKCLKSSNWQSIVLNYIQNLSGSKLISLTSSTLPIYHTLVTMEIKQNSGKRKKQRETLVCSHTHAVDCTGQKLARWWNWKETAQEFCWLTSIYYKLFKAKKKN